MIDQETVHALRDVVVPVFVGVVITITCTLLTFMASRFIKRWKAQKEKEDEKWNRIHEDLKVVNAKVHCTVEGLKKMNGATSIRFTDIFDEKYAELKKLLHLKDDDEEQTN